MAHLPQLLQWSIANTSSNGDGNDSAYTETVGKRSFEPDLINAVFGASDAQKMAEAIHVIVDESQTMQNRQIASDNLELLVEHIDNANDLGKLGIWPKLLSIFARNDTDGDDVNSKCTFKHPLIIRKYSAWIMGTAVQNNPIAAKSMLAENGLEKLLKAFSNETDLDVCIKLTYCISSLCSNDSCIFNDAINNGLFEIVVLPSLLGKSRFSNNSNTENEHHDCSDQVNPADDNLTKLRAKCLFMLQKMSFSPPLLVAIKGHCELMQVLHGILADKDTNHQASQIEFEMVSNILSEESGQEG